MTVLFAEAAVSVLPTVLANAIPMKTMTPATMITTMMMTIPVDWLAKNWIALVLIAFVFRLLWNLWQKSDYRQYADVIAKSKDDAQYWFGKKGEDFTEQDKREVYKRDKGLCQACLAKGRNAKTKNAPKGLWQRLLYSLCYLPGLGFIWINDLAEIDHKIFKSVGGKRRLRNGRVLHRIENRKRSNKPDRVLFEELRESGEKIYLK